LLAVRCGGASFTKSSSSSQSIAKLRKAPSLAVDLNDAVGRGAVLAVALDAAGKATGERARASDMTADAARWSTGAAPASQEVGFSG
jgi:hypothetical protein